MKISLTFYPNHQKINKKNGSTSVYARVCMSGKKSEARLNAELTREQIIRWDPMTMRVGEKNSLINQQLNRIEQKFHEFIALNSTVLYNYDALQIKNIILGKGSQSQKTVLGFAEEYYNNNVINNVDRMPGTVKNYRRSLNHLINYLKFRKQENLSFNELNYEFAEAFKNYLINTNIDLNRIGMTEVSASGIIKKFRTIFSEAVEKELLSKNPFKQLKIKTKSPKRERLTIQQLKQLIKKDLTQHQAQQLYRDIFLFCCLTGLAYTDVMGLTWKNIEIRSETEVKLTLSRVKTDILTECFLPSLAIQIILKYKQSVETQITGCVLPRRSNKELNSQLKTIATLSEVYIKLSTHIARHTFRQLLAEAGIEDYGVIKRMMGQSRNGDVDEIYYSVTESRLLVAHNKFETFLKNNLK